MKEATHYHPSGFRIVPAYVSFEKLMLPKANDFLDIFYKLTGDADFVLIDSAAGLGQHPPTPDYQLCEQDGEPKSFSGFGSNVRGKGRIYH